jgi:polysaccharide biosynthesis/export protein
MMRIMARGAALQLIVSMAFLAPFVAFPGHTAAAQAGPAPSSSAERSSVDGQPLLPLGPGDTVSLRVFGQPEMDGTLYVADDGTLNVPLAGPIAVAGLSSNDASTRVEKALIAGGYLTNPHVTLVVTQSRSQRVTVLGEVHTPGRYPVESHTTILDLLAQAGGLAANAGDVVYVLHPEADGSVTRRIVNLRDATEVPGSAPDRVIQSGESVFVPRAEQFYIYGAVTSPNAYRLEANMTVRQALARAGGLTARGSDGRIEIQRRDGDGRETTVSAKLNDRVQANDVIKVKESLF